jgi:ABC-2 type transport system ATP-binding protein
MSTAISVSGLRKSFGSVVALDGLDLEVQTGQVHGFLGPNGAGKSTTIRILLGLVRADAGSVTLLGGDPWRDVETLHRRLAYVPGDVTLWPNLSGGEVIDLLGRLRGQTNVTRRNELIERFELDPTKKGRTYSKGNRQKVALIAGLASDVELLLLDEPTSGLDPLMEAVFRSAVEDLRREGRTVLLSSHILSEVEALADHVSIIRAGRTVESGALSDMRHLSRTSVDAVLADVPPVALLEGIAGVEDLTTDGSRVAFTVDTARVGEVLARLGQHGIQSLTCQPPTLEQLFMKEYRSAPAPEKVRA